jgi:peptidyl-prolyl cis-trans isomerase SurA
VTAAIAALSLIAGTAPTAAQFVMAVVNGIPITSYDVDQRAKLIQISTQKSHSRKQVLEELIDEKIKIAEARRWSIEPSRDEVDATFANMASRLGMKAPQLEQALSSRGVSPTSLKNRIAAEIAWGNLVRGRFQASLQVGEGDIHAALGAPVEGDQASIGHVYTLRPVLFIVPQGSPPSAFETRRREAEAFRSRFTDCERGVVAARELRDVAVRDTMIRASASLPEQLRKMLNTLEIGRLTPPEPTAQGVEMFALCAKETTRAETPRRQEARNEIFSKRYDAQSKRYLSRLRRSAMIEYK